MDRAFQTLALLGATALFTTVARAQDPRDRLVRDIPDSRSQSFDDRELDTPHHPGGTRDREPTLNLGSNFGDGFEPVIRMDRRGGTGTSSVQAAEGRTAPPTVMRSSTTTVTRRSGERIVIRSRR